MRRPKPGEEGGSTWCSHLLSLLSLLSLCLSLQFFARSKSCVLFGTLHKWYIILHRSWPVDSATLASGNRRTPPPLPPDSMIKRREKKSMRCVFSRLSIGRERRFCMDRKLAQNEAKETSFLSLNRGGGGGEEPFRVARLHGQCCQDSVQGWRKLRGPGGNIPSARVIGPCTGHPHPLCCLWRTVLGIFILRSHMTSGNVHLEVPHDFWEVSS